MKELRGQHLTPILLKVSGNGVADTVADAIPPEAASFFQGAMDENRAFSFGDEEALDGLVDALGTWMKTG